MVEYTDPNPFKIFHIGHLMANAIGESLSRVVEFSGAETIRVCYQGDVGAIYGSIFNRKYSTSTHEVRLLLAGPVFEDHSV